MELWLFITTIAPFWVTFRTLKFTHFLIQCAIFILSFPAGQIFPCFIPAGGYFLALSRRENISYFIPAGGYFLFYPGGNLFPFLSRRADKEISSRQDRKEISACREKSKNLATVQSHPKLWNITYAI